MNPTLTREQIESLLKRGKEATPLIDPPHMLLNDASFVAIQKGIDEAALAASRKGGEA